MKYFYGLTIYFLFFTKPLLSQEIDTLASFNQYFAEYYGIEEGLPDLNINDIYQDTQGFLWLATNNGLSRFNGQKFENFKHDPNDKNSLADNRVRAIHQSQDGLLWIGSFEGLNSIEPHSKEFTRFSPSSLGGTLPGRTIMDITPDPTDTNYLWISLSDSGVARLDLNTKIFDSYKLPPESKGRNTVLNPIHVTKDGNVWSGAFGNIRSGLWKLNPNTGNWEHVLKRVAENQLIHKINDIVEDNAGYLWLATGNDGLVQYDPKTNRYEHFRWDTDRFYSLGGKVLEDLGNSGVEVDILEKLKPITRERFKKKKDFISAIDKNIGTINRLKYQDLLLRFSYCYDNNHVKKISKVNGFLFLATSAGVFRFDLKKKTFEQLFDGNYKFVEVPKDGKKGLIWGVQPNGLVKVPLDARIFERFFVPQDCIDCHTRVLKIIETEPGNLFLGNAGDYPIVQFNENSKAATYTSKKIIDNTIAQTVGMNLGKSQSVFPMETVEGGLWFGGKGVNQFIEHPPSYVQHRHNDIPVNTAFFNTDKQTIWHTSDGQLASFNTKTEQFKIYDINNSYPDTILNLEIAPDNHVWFWQDYSNILFEFNPVSETFTAHDTSSIMGTILPTDNLIWIGNEDGLYSYSPQTKEKRLHRPLGEDILFTVYDIVQYARKDLWMSTSRGLLRYNPENNTARLYDEKDGVPEKVESLFISRSGYVYAGYQDGFFRFHPDRLETVLNVPPVVLTGLSIFNEAVDFRQEDSPLDKPFSQTKTLTLQHDQNYLKLDFIFASHLKSEYNRYAYILQGVDKDWNESKLTQAIYTSVPPGEYTFKAKAINVDGQWSEVTELSITILPPWWETWWARTTALIILISLIGGYYRYKTQKLKKRQEELENTVKERTEEIATQNEELFQQSEELAVQRDSLHEANKAIMQKNEMIVDSINYAKRIQEAILPTDKELRAALGEHFVIFRPKDIVSGDFYWMLESKEYTFIAVVDCTGHGVPGACMSMMGSSLLNRIVGEMQIHDPAEILQILDSSVVKSLRQNESANKDGMDMTICRIEKKNNDDVEVAFAGAKNGLFYYDGDEKLTKKIRGERFSIGGVITKQVVPVIGQENGATDLSLNRNSDPQDGKIFKTHFIIPPNNSTLYLTTDGIIDQNDSTRKRWGSRNLREVLNSSGELPIHRQKLLIENALDSFSKDEKQRDDMAMVAIKL